MQSILVLFLPGNKAVSNWSKKNLHKHFHFNYQKDRQLNSYAVSNKNTTRPYNGCTLAYRLNVFSSRWQVVVSNHALQLGSVFPLNHPQRGAAITQAMCWVISTWYKTALRTETLDNFGTKALGFVCFLKNHSKIFFTYFDIVERQQSCQHLRGLVQGQNTKREMASLRENNIHALSSSQHRLRRLSVRMCVQSGVTLGSKS